MFRTLIVSFCTLAASIAVSQEVASTNEAQAPVETDTGVVASPFINELDSMTTVSAAQMNRIRGLEVNLTSAYGTFKQEENYSEDEGYDSSLEGQYYGAKLFAGYAVTDSLRFGVRSHYLATDWDYDLKDEPNFSGEIETTELKYGVMASWTFLRRITLGLDLYQSRHKYESKFESTEESEEEDDSSVVQRAEPSILFNTGNYEIGLAYAAAIESDAYTSPNRWTLHGGVFVADHLSVHGRFVLNRNAAIDDTERNSVDATVGVEWRVPDTLRLGAELTIAPEYFRDEEDMTTSNISTIGLRLQGAYAFTPNFSMDVEINNDLGAGTRDEDADDGEGEDDDDEDDTDLTTASLDATLGLTLRI